MQINQYQRPVGNVQYRSTSFRRVVETHLNWLDRDQNKQIREVPNEVALRWRGDFYGLLNELGIPSELHWVTMRMNGLRASTEFNEIPDTINIPVINSIQRLLRRQINSNTEL